MILICHLKFLYSLSLVTRMDFTGENHAKVQREDGQTFIVPKERRYFYSK